MINFIKRSMLGILEPLNAMFELKISMDSNTSVKDVLLHNENSLLVAHSGHMNENIRKC